MVDTVITLVKSILMQDAELKIIIGGRHEQVTGHGPQLDYAMGIHA